jgi:hypothetical protein
MRGERWLPPGVSADIRQTTNSAPPGAMHAVLDEANFRGAVCPPAAPFFSEPKRRRQLPSDEVPDNLWPMRHAYEVFELLKSSLAQFA